MLLGVILTGRCSYLFCWVYFAPGNVGELKAFKHSKNSPVSLVCR